MKGVFNRNATTPGYGEGRSTFNNITSEISNLRKQISDRHNNSEAVYNAGFHLVQPLTDHLDDFDAELSRDRELRADHRNDKLGVTTRFFQERGVASIVAALRTIDVRYSILRRDYEQTLRIRDLSDEAHRQASDFFTSEGATLNRGGVSFAEFLYHVTNNVLRGDGSRELNRTIENTKREMREIDDLMTRMNNHGVVYNRMDGRALRQRPVGPSSGGFELSRLARPDPANAPVRRGGLNFDEEGDGEV
jgi:hypothetical protein